MYELEYVRKRKRKIRAAIIGGISAIGVSVLVIVAFLGRFVGTFTVTVDNGEVKLALSETSADGNNRVTAVSCSTIAKKPTMSVESSNAYSATQFKTARYTRTIGSKKINFGSWSEYGVFGRVLTDASANASLFASGAALGYSRDGYPSQAANV